MPSARGLSRPSFGPHCVLNFLLPGTLPPCRPSPCPKTHRLLNDKLSQERIAEIVLEAVSIEKEFICDALPVDLIGMNAGLMAQVGLRPLALG